MIYPFQKRSTPHRGVQGTPRRGARWRIRAEKGQSLVEFALVMIFIIIPLTLGLIEASVILYKYVSLTNTAREGARAGSIYLYTGDPGGSSSAPDAGRRTAVWTEIDTTLGPFIPRPPDCNGGTGADTTCQLVYGPSSLPIPNPLRSTDAMTVTLSHTHNFFFGALGSNINLPAQASMRIEPSTVISAAGP